MKKKRSAILLTARKQTLRTIFTVVLCNSLLVKELLNPTRPLRLMYELQSHGSENEDGRLHLDVAEHFFSKKKKRSAIPLTARKQTPRTIFTVVTL